MKRGERSMNEYKSVNPILKIVIKMNPPFFQDKKVVNYLSSGGPFCRAIDLIERSRDAEDV